MSPLKAESFLQLIAEKVSFETQEGSDAPLVL